MASLGAQCIECNHDPSAHPSRPFHFCVTNGRHESWNPEWVNVLKGPDFSRAASIWKYVWALATEGCYFRASSAITA